MWRISSGTSWFPFPPQEDSISSDIVFVLVRASDGRHKLVAQMFEQRISQSFVVSNPSGTRGKVGSEDCHGNPRPQSDDGIWCLQADSVTTGEAMTIGELTKK